MSEGDKSKQRDYSVRIAKPNLGYPFILQIDPKLKTTSFVSKLLIASDVTNSERCEKLLINNIKFVPILDYKLELKFLLEKKKQEQKNKQKEIKKVKKKRGFFSRLFRRKKKSRLSTEELKRLTFPA